MVEAENGAEVLYDDGEPKPATDHATEYLMKIPMGRTVPRPTQPPATVTMDPQLAQVTMAGVHYGTWTPTPPFCETMRQTLAEAALVVREAYDDQRWTDVLKSSDKAVDDVYKRYKEHRKQLMTDRKVVELKTAIKAYEGVRRESPEEMEMATWSSEKMMKWGRDKLEIRARLCGLEPEAKVTKTELTAALMRRRDELISTTDAAARHGKWGMAAAGARSAGAAFRTKHENAARHDTRWDDAVRVTQMSDPKAIGRLINGRRAPTEFAEMVPAELDDDTMRPDAISDPELRRRLQQRDDWTTPAAARARDVEVDADGVIRTLEGLLDNTANFYGNLTRERASSGLAQKLLLDSMPPECRLPAATVEEMGAPMTNDEVLAALHALKNGSRRIPADMQRLGAQQCQRHHQRSALRARDG